MEQLDTLKVAVTLLKVQPVCAVEYALKLLTKCRVWVPEKALFHTMTPNKIINRNSQRVMLVVECGFMF